MPHYKAGFEMTLKYGLGIVLCWLSKEEFTMDQDVRNIRLW